MTLTDIEEYSLRLIAVLGCNMHGQITVGNVTLPKAVLSTVKIFAVIVIMIFLIIAKKYTKTSFYSIWNRGLKLLCKLFFLPEMYVKGHSRKSSPNINMKTVMKFQRDTSFFLILMYPNS